MISRRGLLRVSALAAPALIFSRTVPGFDILERASASVLGGGRRAWQPFGQIKPDGIPHIDPNHPQSRGLIFDAIDTGQGFYKTLTPGHPINPPGVTGAANPLPLQSYPSGPTPYGNAMLWNGTDIAEYGAYAGVGASFTGTTDISDFDITQATCLSGHAGSVYPLPVQPAGAGYTLWVAFRATGLNGARPPWIFGRPSHAGEASPFENCGITNGDVAAGGAQANYKVYGYAGSNPSAGWDPGGPGIFITAALVCVNTSAGVSTATFVTQGLLRSTIGTGLSLDTTNYAYGQDGESQLQIGAIYHVDTGKSFNNFVGSIYGARIWNYAKPLSDLAYLHANPWCHLLAPEVEMADMAQSNPAFLFNSGYSFMLGHK